MTLLAPAALWFGLIGLGVVALYLLKLKRRRESVPSLEFWRQLVSQSPARTLFQRLKRWLSLLLWLGIIAFLVLALANPILSAGKIKPAAIVVVFDNSASMQARETQPMEATRLELAQQQLNDLLTGRPVNDEWMLIEAAREPTVRVAWTRNRRAMRDAADAVAPFHGATDISAACDLARQLLAGKENGRIVVLSDGGGTNELTQRAAADDRLTFWPIGETDDNLGIVRLNARTTRSQGDHSVFIEIANAGAAAISTELVLEINDEIIDVLPISVPSRGTWRDTIRVESSDRAVLRASIARTDALPVDNEAFAILTPPRPATVHLVSAPRESFFYEQALAAMSPLIDIDRSRNIDPRDYNRADATAHPADVTIFNNVAAPQLPERGTFICINTWPADLSLRAIARIERPTLSIAATEHPLMRYLTLGAVTLASAQSVDLLARTAILATSVDADPLIFTLEDSGRRFLFLAFDVLESDLPFRNAFPILLRNAIVEFANDESIALKPAYAIGAPIDLGSLSEASEGEMLIRTSWQAGDGVSAPVGQRAHRLSGADRAGYVEFEFTDRTLSAAINLTNAAESNIAPRSAASDPTKQLALSRRFFGTTPWLALALLATLLVGGEWLTYHMRWTE